MGVGAGPYMYVVVVQKFTFAISSPDEFLCYWMMVVMMDTISQRAVIGVLRRVLDM